MSKLDEYSRRIMTVITELKKFSASDDFVTYLGGNWLEPECWEPGKPYREEDEVPVESAHLDPREFLGVERETDDAIDLVLFISPKGWQVTLESERDEEFNEGHFNLPIETTEAEIADVARRMMEMNRDAVKTY